MYEIFCTSAITTVSDLYVVVSEVFCGLCCCREDWKPVLTISSVIYGLQFLFLVGTYMYTLTLLQASTAVWKNACVRDCMQT